jgi:hypothetical protein
MKASLDINNDVWSIEHALVRTEISFKCIHFLITSINIYMTREDIYKEKEEKTEGDFLKFGSSEKTNWLFFFAYCFM